MASIKEDRKRDDSDDEKSDDKNILSKTKDSSGNDCVNLAQSFVPKELKECEFDINSFSGILNNDVETEINIIGGENTRVVEAEVNFIHHHHPADPAKKIEAELNKHIEDVRDSLRTLYSSEVAWAKPMGNLIDIDLEPEDFYVQMEMEELNRSGKLLKMESVQLNDFLMPEKGHQVPPKRILVRGEAGMGKTTLCIKIAYDWSVGKIDNMAQGFHLLIMFRLRDLLEKDSLEHGLARFCQVNASSNVDADFTLRALQENARRILIILDGFDELSEIKRLRFVNSLKLKTDASQMVFRNSTIIVTSRTTEKTEFLQLFQRHYRIVGLTRDSTDKIVKNMFPFNTIRQIEILSCLNKYILRFSTRITPFMLHLICFLFLNKDVRELKSPSSVMKDVLLLMGTKCRERLSSSMDQITMMNLFHKLGEFYLGNLQKMKLSCPRTDIETLFENELERKFILECGILQPIKSLSKSWERANWVEPIHKLVIDYVTTSYLQNGFDSQLTTDDKIAFVIQKLRPHSFALHVRSPNDVKLFTSGRYVVGVQFITTWNPVNDITTGDILKNGRFYFSDDEVYRKSLEEFEHQMKQLGHLEMFLYNKKQSRGFPGSILIFAEHIIGRDFLSAMLENEQVANQISIVAVFSHFPLRGKQSHNILLNVSLSGQVAWSVSAHFVGLDFNEEDWFLTKEKDNIVLEQEFYYRFFHPETPYPDVEKLSHHSL